jgi:glycosyltransferase involved in cell wall biosynthesis
MPHKPDETVPHWNHRLTAIKERLSRLYHVVKSEGASRLVAIFFATMGRWKEELTRGASVMNDSFDSDARLFQKRILVVDHKVITPDRDSASYRMFNLLKLLQRMGYGVWFSSIHLEYDKSYSEALRKEGIFLLTQENARSVSHFIDLHGSAFDLLLFSRITVFEKLADHGACFSPKTRLIFDTVDLHFLREERMAAYTKSIAMAKAAESMKRRELDAVRKSDLTLVVSPYEKALLERLAPGNPIEIVSNIHEVSHEGKPFHERRGLLFIGGFDHRPNIDAMLFFVKDIFPLIQKRMVSPITLHIVGSNPPEKIRKLASAHIVVTGYVADVSLFFENARVFVAPLPYGAGVKGKVNMSMSYGLPVVGTSIAAEGMAAIDGENILVADEPAAFAGKVLQIYSDEALWRHISEKSREVIESSFSIEIAEERLRKSIGSMG